MADVSNFKPELSSSRMISYVKGESKDFNNGKVDDHHYNFMTASYESKEFLTDSGMFAFTAPLIYQLDLLKDDVDSVHQHLSESKYTDKEASFGGKVKVPALILNGTEVTSTATELNLLDGVSGLVKADLTKLAAINSTATELNLLDGITHIKDEDDMTSDSATSLATQQSIKAYVDANGGGTVDSSITDGSTNAVQNNAVHDALALKATTAAVGGDLIPSKDNIRDLGSSAKEWKDLYVDGTANIDRLDVDAIGTNLLPVTPASKTGGQYIGSQKARWKGIYLASEIDCSGSNLIISSPSASAAGDDFNVVISGSIVAGDTDSGSIGTIDAPFKDLYVQSSSIYLANMSDYNFGAGSKKWSQMSKSEKLQRSTIFRKDDVDKLKRGESLNDSGHISASGNFHVVGSTHLKGTTLIEGNTTIDGLTDVKGGFRVNGQTITDNELRALRGFSHGDGDIQSQLNSKQPTLTFGISNTNVIKAGSGIADDDFLRINGTTLEGRSASELKGDLSLVKGDVGLGNVDNTSDASKPVSTLTTAALNKKLNTAGGTMTGLVQEPFVLTDSATIATAKGVIDARATRVFQILNQKGQTWNVVEAAPAYRGQELTIIAMGAGTITHTNPGKLSSGIFVSPNGSNISVAANTVVKFVANFRLCWYQVV